MLIFLIITLLLETCVIAALAVIARRYAQRLMAFEDTIDAVLDDLDTSYGRISRVALTPTFSDEPQVRDVVAAVNHARAAVLRVAQRLAESNVIPQDRKKDDGEKQ